MQKLCFCCSKSNTICVRSEDNTFNTESFPRIKWPTASFLAQTTPVEGGDLQDFCSYNFLQGSCRLQIYLVKVEFGDQRDRVRLI